MTGSGKTGLCIDLIEEAAIDGVPAIAIDPKGDLGNLLLTFPELRAGGLRAVGRRGEARARRAGRRRPSPRREAERWREGLAALGPGRRAHRAAARGRRLRDLHARQRRRPAARRCSARSRRRPAATTPRAPARRGRGTVDRPAGARRHRGRPAAQPRAHPARDAPRDAPGSEGETLDLPALIAPHPDAGRRAGRRARPRVVLPGQGPLRARDGASTTCSRRPASTPGCRASRSTSSGCCTPPRASRASRSSRSRTSPTPSGCSSSRCCCSAVVGWMRAQPGTTSLRAILYMDEVFGYLPPVAEPPSKAPLLTLLKQARAFGLGVVLATQNPVDLDYKAPLQRGHVDHRPAADRARPRALLDGLEGAARPAPASTARASRARPRGARQAAVPAARRARGRAASCSQSRWAMSYLARAADARRRSGASTGARRPPRRRRAHRPRQPRQRTGAPPHAADGGRAGARRPKIPQLLPAACGGPQPAGASLRLRAARARRGERALPDAGAVDVDRGVESRTSRRSPTPRRRSTGPRRRRPASRPRRRDRAPAAGARYAALPAAAAARASATRLASASSPIGSYRSQAVALMRSDAARARRRGRARTRPSSGCGSARTAASSATPPSRRCAQRYAPKIAALEERIRRAEPGRRARARAGARREAAAQRSRSARPCSARSSAARSVSASSVGARGTTMRGAGRQRWISSGDVGARQGERRGADARRSPSLEAGVRAARAEAGERLDPATSRSSP